MLRRVKAGARGQAPGAACQLLGILALTAGLAHAAIFPDALGDYKKSAPKALSLPDQPLLSEYGLEATEQTEYSSPKKHFVAAAWRFNDSTGAMAFFEARRPPVATPSKLSELAATTSDGVIYAYGNYVFQFTGAMPSSGELTHLYDVIPKLEKSPLPALLEFLPAQGLIPNSQRYVLGPVSLDRFEPGIPPSVAAFHLGAEALIGTYKTDKGPMKLGLFSYPTPGIARQQYEQFEKVPGVIAKRSGPLVAAITQAPDADAPEKLLAQVRYEQNLTFDEKPPDYEAREDARILLNIFTFAGILLGLCVLTGIGFGAFRVVLRKLGWKGGYPEPLIVLHLGDK